MAKPQPTSPVQCEEGKYIPSSQRPDGTWRKPRRIKEGYIPQEEVPLYESKGKQWAKSKPTHVVGMTAPVSAAPRHPICLNNNAAPKRATIPGLTISPQEKATKSKKKKKKKQSDSGTAEVTALLQETQIKWPSSEEKQSNQTQQESTKTTDPVKRLKNLKKRLREVEQLENKITSGELKNPDKDQLEKLKRKEDLKDQIADLEEALAT